MPSLWLTGEPNSEVREEQKEVLFNTGFVRYIDIHGEANLRIIPPEITKVLKKLVKEYPYSLGTYIIAPGKYSLIRIYADVQDLITLSAEDLEAPKAYGGKEISKQRAHTIEEISYQLSFKGELWYTVYYSETLIIQAKEVIGLGTVEKVRKGHVPLKVSIPCTLPEITALGMADTRILQQALDIVPALMIESEPNMVSQGAGSPTEKSKAASTGSTETEEQEKATE